MNDSPLIHLWPDEASDLAYHLDVRDLIESQGEPYSIIMDCVQQIHKGECLILHVPFEPKPLMTKLNQMGFTFESKRVEPDHWTVGIHLA